MQNFSSSPCSKSLVGSPLLHEFLACEFPLPASGDVLVLGLALHVAGRGINGRVELAADYLTNALESHVLVFVF